jgi:hypothetical protein
MAHGFALIGIQAKLVNTLRLAEALVQEKNVPIVWLHAGDYERVDVSVLQGVAHFVQVPPLGVFFADVPRIVSSKPDFVHGTCPRTEKWIRSGYQAWRDRGLVVTGIPRACDTLRYFPDEDAQAVDGPVGYHEERWSYTLEPLSPYAYPSWHEESGDTAEHGFKVLGSGGLAIFKGAQYRDIFGPDEILIADTAEQYAELRDRALTDKEWNLEWRAKGFQAVREHHTYAHRARQIMATLGLMDYGVNDG